MMRLTHMLMAGMLTVMSASCSKQASEHHHGHPGPDHPVHQHGKEGHAHHRFENPEQWAQRFENPERDAWQKPAEVIQALELTPNMVVADIGSGTGYFAVRLAAAVPQGRVWGVDIEPAMVRYLNARADKADLDNLHSILGAPDGPLLPQPVDRVLIVDTYHHISERVAYLKRVAGYLKPGGWLVIVDFKMGDLPVGPPNSMKLPPEQVEQELREAGFVVTKKPELLPYQYVIFAEASEQ